MPPLNLNAPDYTADGTHLGMQLAAFAVIPIILLCVIRGGVPERRELAMTAAITAVVLVAFALSVRSGKRHRLTLVGAAPGAGLRVRVGPLFADLPDVESDAFPTLDTAYWITTHAFDTRDAGVRLFELYDTQREFAYQQPLCGALIHVPRAAFARFRLATRMGAVSSPAHPTDWLMANYTLTTDDAARITRIMRADAIRAFQQLDGWRMEGGGDWVLIWNREPFTTANLRPIAERSMQLALALRG